MQALLQLGLSLVLLAPQYATTAAVPSSQCQKQCGNVDIPYPFGIGEKCSLSRGFTIKCTVKDGIHKPFWGDFEVLDISLTHATIRVLNYILGFCYNTSTSSMVYPGLYGWGIESSPASPLRLSNVQNKFMGVATCRDPSDLVDGSCSGMGCFQTDMDFF